MQTIVSDVSRVALLRKRLGHAATAMKVIGLFSAVIVAAYVGSYEPLVGLALCILGLCFAFWLPKRLRFGDTLASRLIMAWVVVYIAWNLLDVLPRTLSQAIDFYTVIGLTFYLLPIYFIIVGLLDLSSYKNAVANNPSKFGLLTLHPWEEIRKGARKRPKFLNRSSTKAYIFVLLTPLPWLFLKYLFRRDPPSDPYAYLGYLVLAFYVSLPFWWLIISLYRRARRHAMLVGDKLLEQDNRGVVLYLRSFLDDSTIKIRARANDGRIFLERFIKITFEELVTDRLWRYGPVVAIGDPRTQRKLAPLGAARDYELDETWQQKAIELMQRASVIVAVIGRSEGFLWEIDTILKLGFKSKLVLLFPPMTSQEITARWDSLVQHMTGLEFPQNIELTHTRAVIFQEDHVTVITANERNDWTYETVIDNAALFILDKNDLGNRLARNSEMETVLSENYGQGLEYKLEVVELKPKKNPTRLITHYGWKFLAVLVALFLIGVGVGVDKFHLISLFHSEQSEMVLVPAGDFTMGSTQDEIETVIAECQDDGVEQISCRSWFQQEYPQRRVFLDAYYMDRFEVTNRSFANFIKARGYLTTAEREGYGYTIEWKPHEGANWQAPAGPGSTAEPIRPVVMVTWRDANAYCHWAGKRLPTEAEWEKAARGTDGRHYPWGESWDSAKANAEMILNATTAVGSYPLGASPYGVQDMAGNVAEWVQDRFAPYSSGIARNPIGPETGDDRVLRGGAWTDFHEAQRTAHRSRFAPDLRAELIGFRCARSAPPSE